MIQKIHNSGEEGVKNISTRKFSRIGSIEINENGTSKILRGLELKNFIAKKVKGDKSISSINRDLKQLGVSGSQGNKRRAIISLLEESGSKGGPSKNVQGNLMEEMGEMVPNIINDEDEKKKKEKYQSPTEAELKKEAKEKPLSARFKV